MLKEKLTTLDLIGKLILFLVVSWAVAPCCYGQSTEPSVENQIGNMRIQNALVRKESLNRVDAWEQNFLKDIDKDSHWESGLVKKRREDHLQLYTSISDEVRNLLKQAQNRLVLYLDREIAKRELEITQTQDAVKKAGLDVEMRMYVGARDEIEVAQSQQAVIFAKSAFGAMRSEDQWNALGMRHKIQAAYDSALAGEERSRRDELLQKLLRGEKLTKDERDSFAGIEEKCAQAAVKTFRVDQVRIGAIDAQGKDWLEVKERHASEKDAQAREEKAKKARESRYLEVKEQYAAEKEAQARESNAKNEDIAGFRKPTAARPVRTWTAASGKFTVSARYAGFVGGNVQLEKEDGKRISVDPSVLSESDHTYLVEVTGGRWKKH